MLTVKSLSGKSFPLEAGPSLTEEENGTVYMDLTIDPTPNNKKFIKDVDENWLISGIQDTKYGHFVISSLDKQGVGEYPSLKIKAIAAFIHKLQTTTFDGYYTGSRTAVEFFRLLSEQTGINFTVVDFKEAFGWEKFGEGVQNIEEFNRAIKNYGYVYLPRSANNIELRDSIGRNVQYVIKNAMNADDMKLSIDRSEVFTFIEGYADYDEEENPDFYESAQLYSTYKSDLYDVIGEKKAPTYKNQKIRHKTVLDRYLEETVENSVKFNISTNFYALRGYPFAVPMLGDRIDVQDESIGLDQKAKLIKLVTHYASDGKTVIGYDLEFGSLNIGQRARSTINSVAKQLSDLKNGRDTISHSALDSTTRAMIADFKDAQTELIVGNYKDGIMGIFLVETSDPNRAVGLTSKGIVLTTNGFAGGVDENLAISPEAINASMIRAGTLYLEEFLGIVGKDGLLTISGDEIYQVDSSDPSNYTMLTPGEAVFSKNLKVIRNDGVEWTKDGHPRFEIPIMTKPNRDEGVELGRRNYQTSNSTFSLFETGFGSHSGRWANFVFLPGMRWDSRSNSAHIEVIVEPENVPTGVVINSVTHRQLIYRDQPNESFVLNVPMPPPTYGAISFLLKFRLDSDYSGNIAEVRSARTWISG